MFFSAVGSLTALAAAGALISAPFFINRFGSDNEESENHIYYDNRRVSTGFAPQQFVAPPHVNEQGFVVRPQWLENYEQEQEPQEFHHQQQPFPGGQVYEQPEQTPTDREINEDEEYSKYLNDYNQWLQEYHNAYRQQQEANNEYQEYYKNYQNWYAQYYREQFGEDPPERPESEIPVNYVNQNNIPGMKPPPINNVFYQHLSAEEEQPSLF